MDLNKYVECLADLCICINTRPEMILGAIKLYVTAIALSLYLNLVKYLWLSMYGNNLGACDSKQPENYASWSIHMNGGQ